MNSAPRSVPPFAFVPVALATVVLLTGCSTLGDFFSGEKVDYRSAKPNAQPLEVPPDLSQLARESRYQPQGGVISAAAAAGISLPPASPPAVPTSVALPATGGVATTPAPGATPVVAAPAATATAVTAAAVGPATVALASAGDVRIERQGQQRWLVANQAPERLWPQVLSFWEARGFTIAEQNAQAGVMETNWNENRAKLPRDAIRNVIGGLLGNLYDTGERDRFRTRIERTASGGSEIYVTHRGAQEVLVGQSRGDNSSTTWTARPNDPDLEAEMLSRLMVALGAPEAPARAAVAAATPAPAAAPAAGPRAAPAAGGGALGSGATSIVLPEGFDRAWRRVGVALDRGGFTVEDRDRSQGLYYVRYVDPRNAGKEEPGWWARLFGDRSNPQEALRYRVAVKAGAEGRTNVSVLNSKGEAETGDNAKRIVALLENELR